jgi:hypothetical protein
MSMLMWLAMGAFKKPRRQQLSCVQGQLPPSLFAIVRISWFKRGRIYAVEEMSIDHAGDDTGEALLLLFKEALKQGADVYSITTCHPTEIGIDP